MASSDDVRSSANIMDKIMKEIAALAVEKMFWRNY